MKWAWFRETLIEMNISQSCELHSTNQNKLYTNEIENIHKESWYEKLGVTQLLINARRIHHWHSKGRNRSIPFRSTIDEKLWVMAEFRSKEVRISEQFDLDIIAVYSFGEEIFGQSAAKSFIADIYSKVWSLDSNYLLHVECRHLPTKDKRYRNIILGSYLIIYRITDTTIDVLRILHSHSSIRKIKTTRQIQR